MRYTRTWYHSRQHDILCVFLIHVVHYCVLIHIRTYNIMPRHSPQPVEQSNPALGQEQRRVSHPILQLHRTSFSSVFGATSMSHCMGTSLPSTAFQPRFCGCRCGVSLDSPFHIYTWRYTRRLWYLPADDVGGRLTGWTKRVGLPSDERAAISIYLVCHPMHLCTSPRPAWSGMMQMVHTGDHPGQSSVLLLPMMDLDPGNMSCVHSTHTFLCEHAARYNVTPITLSISHSCGIRYS